MGAKSARALAKQLLQARLLAVAPERFKHIAKEMRTKASLSAGDSRHRFYDGRVKKWSADAETIVSMGFDLPAAIMALQNKSGRTDE